MPIASSNVADGQTATAAQYNNLRDDVLNNHDHGSGGGIAINHGDCSDGTITGTYHNHANLRTHLMGTGESFDDNPGGSQGVHGLISGQYVMGSAGAQYIVAFGSDTLSGSTKTVSTGVSFGSIVNVHVTFRQDQTGDDHYPLEVWVDSENAGAGTFKVNVTQTSFDNAQFYWMCVGTPA